MARGQFEGAHRRHVAVAADPGRRHRDRRRPTRARMGHPSPPLARLDFDRIPGRRTHHGDRAHSARRAPTRSGRQAGTRRGSGAWQHGPAHSLAILGGSPCRRKRATRPKTRNPRGRPQPGWRSSTGGSDREHADRFFLFHRERRWNPRQNSVDGLGAQARQDRGVQSAACEARTDTSFTVRSGDPDILPSVRVLHHARLRRRGCRATRRSAHRHHRASVEPARGSTPHVGRVTEGLRRSCRPRVSVTMASAAGLAVRPHLRRAHRRRSLHDRCLRRRIRISSAKGIFTGKGLYDVDAFVGRAARAACRRTPCCRTICSRACTLRGRRSSPTSRSWTTIRRASRYAHARRQHRWVRGDWQILWWLLPIVPDARSGLQRNRAAADRALEDFRQPASQPAWRRRRRRCSWSDGGPPCCSGRAQSSGSALGLKVRSCFPVVDSAARPDRLSAFGRRGTREPGPQRRAPRTCATAVVARALPPQAVIPRQRGVRHGARDRRDARARPGSRDRRARSNGKRQWRAPAATGRCARRSFARRRDGRRAR